MVATVVNVEERRGFWSERSDDEPTKLIDVAAVQQKEELEERIWIIVSSKSLMVRTRAH